MLGCLRWCFGGRSDEEKAEKRSHRYDDPAKLDAEYQQIQRGIAARLAQADVAERIRIRDLLRDKDEQWLPEGMTEKDGVRQVHERDGEEKQKKKEEDRNPDNSSDAATDPLKAPQIYAMSPMMCSAAPEPESPMSAELQPVLHDLPDETRLCSSGHNDVSEDESANGGSDRATE
ncbi:hypothetical protein PG990_004616 [Apiospora arundinis]